jgi:hypothetical protein
VPDEPKAAIIGIPAKSANVNSRRIVFEADLLPSVIFAIRNPQFTIGNRCLGGIAQLVERQLCKLEVRGSNPLASTFDHFS